MKGTMNFNLRDIFNTKDFFKRNIGLKIAALVCAIILFVLTPENQDLYRNEIFANIPLTVNGCDVMFENGFVLSEPLPNSVKITLSGRLSDLREIEKESLKASVDVSDILSEGSILLPVEIDGLSFQPVEFAETPVLEAKIDMLVTTFMNLRIQMSDETAENTRYSTIELLPNEIQVRGGKSIVDTISNAVVYFDTLEPSQTIHQTLPIYFLDSNGKEVDSNYLYTEDLFAELVAYPFREVDVEPALLGQPASGYMVTSIDMLPARLYISGEPALLNTIDKLATEAIDISGYDKMWTGEVPISSYKDVTLSPGQKTTVTVAVNIEKVMEKSFDIGFDDIELLNLNSKYRTELSDETFEILLEGPQSEIESMTEADISITMDMSDAKIGTSTYVPIIKLNSQYTKVIDAPDSVSIKVKS